jgi:SAM-dependent methyltransferase
MKFNHTEYKKRNITIWNEVAPRYHKRWASINQGPFQSTSKLIQCLGVTAIKTAKKWVGVQTNLDFVNMDAENFSFSKQFDIITCQYALFFFPNAQKALKNIKKNLKKRGKLGITVHGAAEKVPFFNIVFDAVTKFIPDYVPPGSPNLDRFGTKTSLKKEVRKAGFSKIIVKNFVFSFSPGTFEDYWRNYFRYVAKPLKEKLDTLDKKERKELRDLIRENVESYTLKNKTIKFPWEVLILTAKN